MSILVIAEHDHQQLKVATLHTVAAAQKIGGDIHLLVVGSNCQAAAEHAASLAGVSTVKPADLGVDVAPRLTTIKVVEPAKRSAGIKVADVAELVNKLKNEAKVI